MTTCRFNGKHQPRTITGRHEEGCPGTYDPPGFHCDGCIDCPEPHCRVCSRVHSDGTCAECLATIRAQLHDIARMCGTLPEEVEHRGINGEAMVLLSPVADPEAWGHREASAQAGRIPADYLADGSDDAHPLWVLGNAAMVWRDALDHTEGSTELHDLVDYLDRQMTYMAGYEHAPFEDFARDLRRCASHLEAVLHDGEQRDTGAPCMTCNVPLERTWGNTSNEDGWRCPRCRQTSTEDQYRFAVQHLHRTEAEWLTDREMEIRTGFRAGTIRVWARRGEVQRKRDQGRTVYSVADVERKKATDGSAA